MEVDGFFIPSISYLYWAALLYKDLFYIPVSQTDEPLPSWSLYHTQEKQIIYKLVIRIFADLHECPAEERQNDMTEKIFVCMCVFGENANLRKGHSGMSSFKDDLLTETRNVRSSHSWETPKDKHLTSRNSMCQSPKIIKNWVVQESERRIELCENRGQTQEARSCQPLSLR